MKQELLELSLNQIHVKSNYRKTFNDKTLKELAQSIKENGVLEPVIVTRNGDGYNLIAGERRVRAAYLAKLITVPAIVRGEVSDKDFLKLQLIENIQREGVQYMEEAYGLRDMRDKCDLDVTELAKLIGKSTLYVEYQLKLTLMAKEAQEAARKGEISKSVAWHISKLPTAENQTQAARDLRRKEKDKLISEWTARKYIQSNFAETGVCQPRQKRRFQREAGGDYQANWKFYLVNFSCEQFEHFKAVVKGRTDTQILAEAVDVVMSETAPRAENTNR